MLKKLLLSALSLLSFWSADAQFRYTFKDTTTAYTSLTGGGSTSLNGTTIWDDDDYTAPMPFSWQMDSTITLNKLDVALSLPAFVADAATLNDLNGFILGDVDLGDRGNVTSTSSLSNVQYTTTGSTPNRIFKVEINNAGFMDELSNYNTMNDFINVQIWIYETTNVVELHFGPSQLNFASDHFFFGSTGPFQGYMKHTDFDMGTAGDVYYLTGSASAPGMDTLTLPVTSFPTNMISSWPDSGKVYRYTPKWKACTQPVASFNSTLTGSFTAQYTYSGTIAGIDSLVWNFGDGQKQKVTSNFTAPVSHTYSTKGVYPATVTAYGTCGSHTSAAKQVSVSVSSIPGLTGVSLYPNPASSSICVEGLSANSGYRILSPLGQAVVQGTISSSKQLIDITGLPAGIYTIMLTDANGSSGAKQFVKQ